MVIEASESRQRTSGAQSAADTPGWSEVKVRRDPSLKFDHTNLDQELADRHDTLFAKMTMPVLFLQGRLDPGQHVEEYENTPDFVTNGRVQFLDGNHFFQLEVPDEASAAMRTFLTEPLR